MSFVTRMLSCVITLLSFVGFGQELSFVNYSTKDGLSSAQVYDIFQDKNGDMFFTTDRGITKYDGYRFKAYTKSDGLTNTTVFNFFPQKDGNVWCSTIDNSWFYFKNGTTEFKPSSLNPIIQKAANGGLTKDIWFNNNGDIYIAYEDLSGYVKINSESKQVDLEISRHKGLADSVRFFFVKSKDAWFSYYRSDNIPDDVWPSNQVRVIKQSRHKMGYKRTEVFDGVFLFSSHNNLLLERSQGERLDLKFDKKIIGLGRYDTDHFWVGFLDGGVKIFHKSGRVKEHWLKSSSPTSLFHDQNGGVWMSTLTEGVYYAQNDKIKSHVTPDNSYVFNISPGEKGVPIISTLAEHFIYQNGELKSIFKNPDSKSRKAMFNPVAQQYEYVLSTAEIINRDELSRRIAIIDYTENRNHPLVVASPYGIFEFENNHYRAYNSKQRIKAVENAENGFLIGGYNGMEFFNKGTGSFEKMDIPELSGRISDIKLMGKYHFIGTNESGLVRYDQRTKQYLQISLNGGLASDLVNEVYPESESIVWVATNSGLDRVTFSGNEYTIKHFGKEHGLGENDISDIYINNGIIWIGTRAGLFSVSKSDFETIAKSTSLNLFWKNIEVDGNVQSHAKKIILDYDQNNFEMEFHSAFYGGMNRVKYRYKIAETNDTWHEISGRSIVFNGLLPGAYKIILQANVDETNWTNNQLFAEFKINPPFYQTWWFRTLIVGFIIFLIYLFFRFRVLIFNRSLVNEALRLIIRKLNPQLKSFLILEQGKNHRVNSNDVLYFKSEGNYLQIHLKDKKHIIRHKIGEFEELVPDKNEYIRVHKSYVLRIDKITGKNLDFVFLDKVEIPIGKTYKKSIRELTI